MLGYDKTLRKCLIEYFIYIVASIIYAFYQFDSSTGRMLLLFSTFVYTITVVICFLVKNEKIILGVMLFSLISYITVSGMLIDNIGLSPLIFILIAISCANFTETLDVIICGTVSTLALIIYGIVFSDKILLYFPNLFLYFFLVLIYVFAVINVYLIVRKSKDSIFLMQQKTEEAERANESKMTFVSNMSHEIRTPMNAIYGLAELILRDSSISPAVRESTENIQKASKVLIAIVNDIIDYSKMEDGKLEIIPVTYSLRKLVYDTVNMMKMRMEDKNLEIRVDIQNDLPDILVGDEIRIRQILFNLLSNAIRYTDKGYIIVKIIGTVSEGFVSLDVSVLDSGIGIRKEELSKLFNSFQQINSRKAKKSEGPGLGLVICKELLNMMGGSIRVESTYGVGSNFTFSILQKISDDDTYKAYNKDIELNSVERIQAPDAKVLLVDDNQVNLKVAKGLLRTFGISVDVASSGKEALDILKTTRDYDILFIDHMMPELDGVDTLNLIRAEDSEYMRKVPIVVLTANVASGVREKFISEGFDEYIAKPIDMMWLNRVLCKLLPKDKIR